LEGGVSSEALQWELKRLEILERDEHRCQDCGEATEPLHVHHRFYETGKKKWDYPSDSLVTLCSKCHPAADNWRRIIVRATGMIHCPEQGIGYLEAQAAVERNQYAKGRFWPIPVRTYEHAVGIGDFFGLTADQVIAETLRGGDFDGMVCVYRLAALSPKKNLLPLGTPE
jgi:hypothetical protein